MQNVKQQALKVNFHFFQDLSAPLQTPVLFCVTFVHS